MFFETEVKWVASFMQKLGKNVGVTCEIGAVGLTSMYISTLL